jgi:hypothetical protein
MSAILDEVRSSSSNGTGRRPHIREQRAPSIAKSSQLMNFERGERSRLTTSDQPGPPDAPRAFGRLDARKSPGRARDRSRGHRSREFQRRSQGDRVVLTPRSHAERGTAVRDTPRRRSRPQSGRGASSEAFPSRAWEREASGPNPPGSLATVSFFARNSGGWGQFRAPRAGRPRRRGPPPATRPSPDHRDAKTGVRALVPAPARGNAPIFPTDSPGANRYTRARPAASATTSSTWAGHAYP